MRKDLPPCPVETAVVIIGSRWNNLIVRDLLGGTKRFGEIKKSLPGISQKVLTENLRRMEDYGLITREVFDETPQRVEYTLTELGISLRPVHDALRNWGKEYKSKIK